MPKDDNKTKLINIPKELLNGKPDKIKNKDKKASPKKIKVPAKNKTQKIIESDDILDDGIVDDGTDDK